MKKLNTILIAPDSFKGSISSNDICDALEAGILRESPDLKVIKVPLADGGEGTVDALVLNTGGKYLTIEVAGPLGEKVDAKYGILGDGKTAIIEMAAASGLTLIPVNQRNPSQTTTFGTGELIIDALKNGCDKIIIGIGGSATNDFGVGALQALGFSFQDDRGTEIVFGCSELSRVVTINTSKKHKQLNDIEFLIACDVDNPLLGEYGATYTYGPQKGASLEMLSELERSMEHINNIMETELNVSVKNIPGAGAAGGLGAGLMAFLNGKLVSGIELVIDLVDLKKHFDDNDIDLVITGEGSMDYQTAHGKLPVGVAKVAQSFSVPVIAIVGSRGEGAEAVFEQGIDSIVSLTEGSITVEESMRDTSRLLSQMARTVIQKFKTDYK